MCVSACVRPGSILACMVVSHHPPPPFPPSHRALQSNSMLIVLRLESFFSSFILLLFFLSFFLEQLGRHWVIWDDSSFMRFCFWARRGFCSWSLARCDGKWRALEPSLFFRAGGHKELGAGGKGGQMSTRSVVKTATTRSKRRRIKNGSNRTWMCLVSLKTF